MASDQQNMEKTPLGRTTTEGYAPLAPLHRLQKSNPAIGSDTEIAEPAAMELFKEDAKVVDDKPNGKDGAGKASERGEKAPQCDPIESRPGAFACSGGTDLERGESQATVLIGVGRSQEPEEPLEQVDEFSRRIESMRAVPEATLVPEVEQVAQPVDDWELGDSPRPPAENTKRNVPKILGSMVLLLLVIVGISAAVTLFAKESDPPTLERTPKEPTANHTLTRQELIDKALDILYLPDFAIENLRRDKDGTSPQFRALEWFMNDPNLTDYHDSRHLQRYQLATMFYALQGENWTNTGSTPNGTSIWLDTGPGGDMELNNFSNLLPWLSYDAHECDWYWTKGLKQKNETVCREDGAVTLLSLSRNGLRGTLPLEFGMMRWLKTVRLGFGDITGSIPWTIGRLTNLEVFLINSNKLTGTLPSTLHLMANSLQRLAINRNKLRGPLMENVWQLTNLRELHAGKNQFTGSIPESIGSQFPRLQHIRIMGSKMTGTLPTTLGMMTQLKTIHLGINLFQGTLPSELANLGRLGDLVFRNSRLSGTIPTQFGRLTSLKELVFVGSRNLTGPIPSQLGLLTGLTALDIGSTGLTGVIPPNLCNATVQRSCDSGPCGCGCPCPNEAKNTAANDTGAP